MHGELNERIANYLTEIEKRRSCVERLLSEMKFYPVWQRFDTLYEPCLGEELIKAQLDIVLTAVRIYDGLGYDRELIREGLMEGTLVKGSPFESVLKNFSSSYGEIEPGSVPDRVLSLAVELALKVEKC